MARAKVIGQVVAGSQPSLSVTGRADGGGYTVASGARSLSITAEAGATLLTTVTDQDNASITVTDSTSTTPSWTAPSGGTTGADYCVSVVATKDGYTEQVSFSELVDGSGGGGGGGYSTVSEVDLTDGNVTAGSTSTAGAFTIYESDGTTPRATGALTITSGSATVSWDSTGIRIVCSGTAFAAFAVPTGSLTDINQDWHVDSIIEPLVSPASSYMLVYLGNTASSSALSVGWDLQNNAQKIEVRRTLSGPSYSWGLTDTLSGVLPSASACRIESRGGAAIFIGWDKTGSAYLPDDWAGTTSTGRAHATAQGIAASDIWTAGGGAYFGLGGTTGVDVKVQKFRIRERT